MSQGWIKLHRELIEKPIWNDSTPEQKSILITLLTMANHKEKEWEWKGEKFKAEPGQFVTSLEKISNKSGKGISIQNVRTAIKRFEKYGFLTNESTNKNRLVTIVNWAVYQSEESEPNKQTHKQPTSNQQATNKQLTTNKNDKNVENEQERIPYAAIVEHLNEKTGKNYKPAARKTRELIQARWNEGYSLEDFKKVIDVCSQKWKGKTFSNGVYGDEYLRPSTLFNGKFDERLNWSLDDEKKVTMLDEWKSDSIKPDKSLFKISGDW